MTNSIETLALQAFGRRNESPPTREEVDATAATIGEGLDHAAGERAWIARPHEVHSSAAVAALLVTNRRIAGVRSEAGSLHLTGAHAGQKVPYWADFSLPYEEIASLDFMMPVVGSEHRVRLRDGSVVRIPRSGAWSGLRTFLQGVLAIPASQRVAGASAEELPPSAWSRVIEHLERMRAAGGIDDATRADLLARIDRHRRAARYGVGGQRGGFATALSATDLGHVLTRLLGPPRRVTSDSLELALPQPGVDFTLLAANAFGYASAAVFGIGITFEPERMPRALRVDVENVGSMCRYTLSSDRGIPLAALRPDVVAALNRTILAAEADLLVRRAALGWNLSALELWNVATDDVVTRYRETRPALQASELPGPP